MNGFHRGFWWRLYYVLMGWGWAIVAAIVLALAILLAVVFWLVAAALMLAVIPVAVVIVLAVAGRNLPDRLVRSKIH